MKIILKVLANRIKNLLPNLIAEQQSAFVNGRQIADSILVTSEIVHSIQSNQTKGIILKLDFEKAFDTVNWDFLMQTLQGMGFGAKWRSWILAIVSSARQSVLINGSLSREFKMNMGLRQGDPLSPLLFIMVTQVLHELIQQAVRLGLLKGVQIGETLSITHLQFADDTIIFLEDTWHSVKGIKIVLTIFEILSGLKINYTKSYLYAPNSLTNTVQSWATWLNCNVGTIPFNHLGSPIGVSCRRKQFWRPLTKKVSTRLGRWKCNTLSKPGRLVLISAVLNALPAYMMSLYKMPKGIAEEIEKTKRRFYWREIGESNTTVRKMHSVNWKLVCKEKNSDGLGIRNLIKKNTSMLAKWWWRAKTEHDKLWYKVLNNKYGDQFLSNPRSRTKGFSSIIRSISQVQKETKLKLFESSDFEWKLGNGDIIRFWTDEWYNGTVLSHTFRRLYSLFIGKDYTVKIMVSFWFNATNESKWRRPLRGWEIQEAMQLQQILNNIKFSTHKDKVIWKQEQNDYSPGLGYRVLDNNTEVLPIWSLLWKQKVPHKAIIFMWHALHNALPTLDYLHIRGIAAHNLCRWCNIEKEDMPHLLWHCSLAKSGWDSLLNWFNIKRPSPPFMSLSSALIFFSSKINSGGGGTCLISMIWTIWLARNECIFNNTRMEKHVLENLVRIRAWEWSLSNKQITKDFKTQWEVSPILAYKKHDFWIIHKLIDKWREDHDFICFVDGSWKNGKHGCKSGIGGFIMDKEKKVIYTFSGPVDKCVGWEVEFRAFHHVCIAIRDKVSPLASYCIATDSELLRDNFRKYRGNLLHLDINNQYLHDIDCMVNINIVLIKRIQNGVADKLAKEGADRSNILSGWV